MIMRRCDITEVTVVRAGGHTASGWCLLHPEWCLLHPEWCTVLHAPLEQEGQLRLDGLQFHIHARHLRLDARHSRVHGRRGASKTLTIHENRSSSSLSVAAHLIAALGLGP